MRLQIAIGAGVALVMTAGTAFANEHPFDAQGLALDDHSGIAIALTDDVGEPDVLDELRELDLLLAMSAMTGEPQDTYTGEGEFLTVDDVQASLGSTGKAMTPQDALEGIGAAFIHQATAIDIGIEDASDLTGVIVVANVGPVATPQTDLPGFSADLIDLASHIAPQVEGGAVDEVLGTFDIATAYLRDLQTGQGPIGGFAFVNVGQA